MKVDPYHTNSPETGTINRAVYHDHDDCFEGKRIEKLHKEKGTAGRRRCDVCIMLG
jgi:hypothetical protein